MIQVIPAIIPESFDDLKTALARVRGLVSLVQVDVMDGTYVPSKTWPYIFKNDRDFQKIVSESEGFPFWEDLDFEVDMMVADPFEKVDDWIVAGAENLIIHIETTDSLGEIIDRTRERGINIGLALKPSTPNETIYPWLEKVNFVQFMGSDDIGHHGAELDPKIFSKIGDFHKKYPAMPMGIDIGVNFETASKLVKSGATRLVSGSAIFDSLNIKDAISQLQNINTELNS